MKRKLIIASFTVAAVAMLGVPALAGQKVKTETRIHDYQYVKHTKRISFYGNLHVDNTYSAAAKVACSQHRTVYIVRNKPGKNPIVAKAHTIADNPPGLKDDWEMNTFKKLPAGTYFARIFALKRDGFDCHRSRSKAFVYDGTP